MTVLTEHVRSQHEIDVMFQHLIFGATTTENLAVQGVTDHSNSNRTLGDFTPEFFDQVKERLEGVPEELKFHVTQYAQERHHIFNNHKDEVDRLARQCADGEITRDEFNAGVKYAADIAQKSHDGTSSRLYSDIHQWLLTTSENYTPQGLWDVVKGAFEVIGDVVQICVAVVVAVASAVWTAIKFIIELPKHIANVIVDIIKWVGRLF